MEVTVSTSAGSASVSLLSGSMTTGVAGSVETISSIATGGMLVGVPPSVTVMVTVAVASLPGVPSFTV